MKYIFISAFLSFLFFQSLTMLAQSAIDSISKEKYKLSKKEFLQLYGKDDTSKAIINYYFEERSVKKEFYYFYTGVFIIEVILAGQSIAYNEHLPYLESSLAPIAIAYTAIVFIPISTYTLLKLNKTHKKFSLKNLYVDLINYQRGNGIPESYKSKLKYISGKI